MGGVARSELVTAVTEAGGYGFLGIVDARSDCCRKSMLCVHARSGPFGVNLIPAATEPALIPSRTFYLLQKASSFTLLLLGRACGRDCAGESGRMPRLVPGRVDRGCGRRRKSGCRCHYRARIRSRRTYTRNRVVSSLAAASRSSGINSGDCLRGIWVGRKSGCSPGARCAGDTLWHRFPRH